MSGVEEVVGGGGGRRSNGVRTDECGRRCGTLWRATGPVRRHCVTPTAASAIKGGRESRPARAGRESSVSSDAAERGLSDDPHTSSAVFRAPQHPQLRRAADLGRGVGKISIRIKTCNSWVTIGFERIKAPIFLPLRSQQGTGDWLCGGEG